MSVQVQHRRDSNANIEAVTPAAGELGFDTTKKEALIGDGSTSGGVRLQKKNIREILTPAQITSNQNDYSPSGLKHAAALRLSTDAARNLTGIVPLTATDAVDGRALVLYNAGSFNLLLQDQNASSTAASRFDLGGSDITLAPKQSLSLRYSGAISRWEVSENNFGQAIADGAVSARKLAASAFGAGINMINGTIVESHAGNAVTFAIKTLAGGDPSSTDPVFFIFRDVTLAAGDFVVRTVTSALSLTISAGSSLGFSSSVSGRIWLTAIDNAGAVLLGAVNVLSGNSIGPLPASGIVTTVAEGGAGAADSSQTMYATSAVTSKAFAVLGFATYEGGLAAAGNWATSPSRLQLFGPGVPLPGTEIQRSRSDTGAVGTGTTLVPLDDTIPQNTEGDLYLTRSITPTSGANLLSADARLHLTSSLANNMVAAMFRDSTANAQAVGAQVVSAASGVVQIELQLMQQALVASSTTFNVRAGGNLAGTTTFNGGAGARLYGGALNSYIELRELMG